MKRLIDMTQPADPRQVPAHIAGLAAKCDSLAHRIAQSVARTDRSVALQNFCTYVAGELRHVASFYPNDVAGLAWAARNLFEANLIVRQVLNSEENFRDWLGQSLNDERELVRGVLSYAIESSDVGQKRTLEERLTALEDMAERHQLKLTKPFRVQDLAERHGERDEYVGLFKLFSKYVHPSSLYINKYARGPQDVLWLNVFLVKSQFYAGDTIGRISSAMGWQ